MVAESQLVGATVGRDDWPLPFRGQAVVGLGTQLLHDMQ